MNTQLNFVDDGASETKASSVYAALKQDILAGKLQPDSKLRLQSLKKKYNIGISPLREALNRLSAYGIVSQQENKGFKVSMATLNELKDIVNTRCMLEEIALRQSIENNDEDYYEKVVLLKYRLARVAQDSKSNCHTRDKDDLHFEFHQTILSGCDSELLKKYCFNLYEQTQRYCNLTINQKCWEDHEEKDHQEICSAILDRDADSAIRLLLSHYQTTKDIVIENGNLQ